MEWKILSYNGIISQKFIGKLTKTADSTPKQKDPDKMPSGGRTSQGLGLVLIISIFLVMSSQFVIAGTSIVGNSQQYSATERNNARLVARDGDGVLHVVYYDNGIIHAYSSDGAQTWSIPFRITDIGRNPSIAVGDDDGLNLVYKRGGTTAYEIVHRVYGGTWSEEVIVYNSPGVPVSRPSLATDSSGDLHCVWQRSGYSSTPNAEIWYSKRTSRGWGGAVNLSNTYGASEYPTLVIGADDKVHVFWKDSGEDIDNPKMVLYRKYTPGSGWDAGYTNVSDTIGNGSYATMDPCAVVDSQNDVHLVWKDYEPGNKEIFYKKCTDGVWDETPINLSETDNASDTPTLGIDDNDNLTLAWAEKADGIHYEIIVREYFPTDDSWSAAVNISNTEDTDSRFPNLPAHNDGTFICIWTEGGSALYDVVSGYDDVTSAPEDATPRDISGVTSWAYQLQDISIAEIVGNTTFDLIVMDYSANGGESGEWAAAEIAQIKSSGKLPVAYISIGEAENYRFYWDPDWDTNPPVWLGPENPDWAGNFKVRFWNPDWQAFIFQWLDRLIAQGFDGVYMDIIDAYYFWSEELPENPQADGDMANFVIAIRDHLTVAGRPDMLVIPQNGSFIVVEDDVEGPLAENYYTAIDAIGIEDVFYFGELDEDNAWNPDEGRLAMLAEYRARNKTVFSVEYLTVPAAIGEYVTAAFGHDFVPYASVRALDVLNDGISTGLDGPIPPKNPVYLTQTWPNPANPKAHFTLYLEEAADLRLDVFDAGGRLVANLHDGPLAAGEYPWIWTAADQASGLYLIRAYSAGSTAMRKALILK